LEQGLIEYQPPVARHERERNMAVVTGLSDRRYPAFPEINIEQRSVRERGRGSKEFKRGVYRPGGADDDAPQPFDYSFEFKRYQQLIFGDQHSPSGKRRCAPGFINQPISSS
jgi:hypothetical protein